MAKDRCVKKPAADARERLLPLNKAKLCRAETHGQVPKNAAMIAAAFSR